MTSLGLGWIGEPAVADLLEPLFALVGISQPAVVSAISFALAFATITYLHIVVGELAPKSLAIQRAERTALVVAPPLHFFFIVFRPFIWLLNTNANFFLKWIGLASVDEGNLTHSEEELRLLLSNRKSISSTSRSILLRAMELRDRTAREVMVPRTNIVFLSTGRNIQENLNTAIDNQFTRYPLCDENLDNVLGMIHIKDIFKLKATEGNGSRLLEITREMLFFPETMPLERILNTFLAKRMLMAMVVDEYGGTAGLITLENVLEELVGEIRDEFDVEPSEVHKLSDTEYLVDGTMSLHVFARMFDVMPDSKEVVTVSGYAIHQIGRVPEKGVSFQIGSWLATVEGTEGKKVKTLKLKKIARPEGVE
jgi:CBS domain containing-hemolysin-like protein